MLEFAFTVSMICIVLGTIVVFLLGRFRNYALNTMSHPDVLTAMERARATGEVQRVRVNGRLITIKP